MNLRSTFSLFRTKPWLVSLCTLALISCFEPQVRADFFYVTDSGNNDIIQYDLAAANHPASVFATAATLSAALGTKVDAPFDLIQNGTNTYVAALGSAGVLVFNGTSWSKQTLFAAASGSTPYTLQYPGYLAVQTVGASSFLLINDFINNQVLRFDLSNGRPAGAVAGSAVYIATTQNGLTLHGPTGIGVDQTGHFIYVTSSGNSAATSEIYKYGYTNSGTGPISSGATFATAANSPSAGAGFAVDRLLNPEASSFGNNKVIAYNSPGGTVAWTATAGINQPAGVINDSTSPENVWVANFGAGNVLELDNQTGATLGTFALTNNSTVFSGTVPTNPVKPLGIIYVAGSTVLETIPETGVPDFQAEAPEPRSLLLLAMGSIGMMGYGWRRRLAPA
ncbi:MAG TPA: hypothetical protein VGZ22_20475 [Isosphaeraceae bacterium]|jgi:hypothetical protein|nr:hypothetical protein [Isosphaeraceae bacterium]